MGTSRYDRFSEVGDREYQESRALHIVADLVREYLGIESVSLRGAMSEVIRQAAIELGQRTTRAHRTTPSCVENG